MDDMKIQGARKKGKATNKKMSLAEARELRESILPQIDRARQALVLTKEHPEFTNMVEVAKAAGHGIATWHSWRKSTEPTSPKFFDLRDFAHAVGLDVRLCVYTAAANGQAGEDLRPETLDVVSVMESGSDELRSTIKGMVLQLLTERSSNPLDAGPGSGSRARVSKS